MTSSLDVDASAWLGGLDRAFGDLQLTSEDEVLDLGRDIVQEMRDGAPRMPADERAQRQAHGTVVRRTPGYRTITLIRGRDREGFFADVGPSRKAFYLAFIEYGTSKLAARPFLRPAIERAIARWGT